MSESRTKLEQILELLLSEDTDQAEAALHEYVVSKAREEYMRVLDESDDEEFGDEEIDQTGDFEDEIAADQDEIHSDETGDEFADDEFADDGEDFADDEDGEFDDDVEDRVDDIEAELEDLRTEFERLMTSDMDDAGDEDFEDEESDDFEDEDFGDEEELEEATKLSDKAPAAKDGKSQADGSANKSPYSDAPKHSKIDSQGKPHHIKDGGEGKREQSAKKHQNPTDSNIGHKPKKAPEPKKKGE